MIFHKFNFLITVPNDLSHTFYFFYNFSQQHQLILVIFSYSCLLSILLIHQTKGRRRHHPESDLTYLLILYYTDNIEASNLRTNV